MKRIILENPGAILTLTDEELAQYYWETKEDEEKIAIEVEQIKATQSVIKDEFATRIAASKRDGKVVGDTSITVYTKVYTNKVTVEVAKALNATKIEEKVDGAKIGKLVKAGAKIEGAEERREVRITKMKQDDEEETA